MLLTPVLANIVGKEIKQSFNLSADTCDDYENRLIIKNVTLYLTCL